MAIYQHIRHPRIASRLADRPVKVADMLPRATAVNRFNTKVALLVTRAVGSMWCAYAFALFDCLTLKSAIEGGFDTFVPWVAQTFLQLVLLSIIMVGQNVQGAAADKRAEATFHDASATLHEVAHVQGHLAAQDVLLTRIAEKIGLDPVPIIDNPPGEDPADAADAAGGHAARAVTRSPERPAPERLAGASGHGDDPTTGATGTDTSGNTRG